MTTLPEPLKSEMEFKLNIFKLVSSKFCYELGYNDLFNFLLKCGMEFDEKESYASFLVYSGTQLGPVFNKEYSAGARWQHQYLTAIYEAKLAAKDAQIKELEEKLETYKDIEEGVYD